MWVRGVMGERMGRIKSRNMYKGPMNNNGRGRIEMWEVGGRARGKWGQL